MIKILTLALGLMLIVNITLYNIVPIRTPDASAAANPTNQSIPTPFPSVPPSVINSTLTSTEGLTDTLAGILGASIFGLVIMIVIPLILGIILTYRQGVKAIGTGTIIRPFVVGDLFRVLVAVGVIFTVVLILIYLNALIAISLGGVDANTASLIEILKSFLTIIGTAFASLVAFYFGTRGSQESNAQRTTAITEHRASQKALEIININPIDGTMGVEVESQVTATFSAPLRSITINANTFSVKDDNGNPVLCKISLTDNNTTIRFNPLLPLNRNSRYTVTATKGLMDMSGASIAADKEWHFTTVA